MCTLHRAENTDDPRRLRDIFTALAESPLPMLVPLHPRTRKTLEREGIVRRRARHAHGAASPISPCWDTWSAARFVVTDSGGVQKEAYFLGKRCITVRDETEWTELVACGANRLVGADAPRICGAFSWAAEPLPSGCQLYGSGDAGRQIVEILVRELVRAPAPRMGGDSVSGPSAIIVAVHYRPEVSGGVPRILIAEDFLVRAGFRVTIVTPQPIERGCRGAEIFRVARPRIPRRRRRSTRSMRPPRAGAVSAKPASTG